MVKIYGAIRRDMRANGMEEKGGEVWGKCDRAIQQTR